MQGDSSVTSTTQEVTTQAYQGDLHPYLQQRYIPYGEDRLRKVLESGLYVDKTTYACKLYQEQKAILLTRPRRFGKTLFIDTLEEIASGHKAVFAGNPEKNIKPCFIYNHHDWTKRHTVIRLNLFNLKGCANATELMRCIKKFLYNIAVNYGVSHALEEDLQKDNVTSEEYLESLIRALDTGAHCNKKYNEEGITFQRQAVILIDEYDAPLHGRQRIRSYNEGGRKTLDHFDVLDNLLGTAKKMKSEDFVHMIFVTGVSRFQLADFGSGANSFDDTSFDDPYATITGYTEEDLIGPASLFREAITTVAESEDCEPQEIEKQLKQWYNGYKFSPDAADKCKVYNPTSILACLKKKKLGNYWIDTGTPSFLLDKFHQKTYFDIDLSKPILIAANQLKKPRENKQSTAAEMFQAGYLTMKGYYQPPAPPPSLENQESGPPRKKLKTGQENIELVFPNYEVREAFQDRLLESIGQGLKESTSIRAQVFRESLENQDITRLIRASRACFASIPSHLCKSKTKKNEAYYHTAFHCYIKGMELPVRSEEAICADRIDMVIEMCNTVYIFEFKYKQASQNAMEQIDSKHYIDLYLEQGKYVITLGFNFMDDDIRKLSNWEAIRYDIHGELQQKWNESGRLAITGSG